jgi:2-C-methyl-D-erythritol 4-phosphate cytidylyltransferase
MMPTVCFYLFLFFRRLADKENAYDALTPVLPLSDSLLMEEEGKILYQERKNRYLVETPQVFTFEKILAVYESGYDLADTDDFQKAVRAGLSSGLVEGESLDFKLTSREDLSLLEKLL